ncbi:hypothetical protein AFLA_000456 [Aspergillus flavus NRRL3357]|nr:hypothetical protein AFLA_000456 [Aspergillus flavus NRRL3357]
MGNKTNNCGRGSSPVVWWILVIFLLPNTSYGAGRKPLVLSILSMRPATKSRKWPAAAGICHCTVWRVTNLGSEVSSTMVSNCLTHEPTSP